MTRTPTQAAPKHRRWLASVLAATAAPDTLPAMPFARGTRRRPASLAKTAPDAPARPTAIAAR